MYIDKTLRIFAVTALIVGLATVGSLTTSSVNGINSQGPPPTRYLNIKNAIIDTSGLNAVIVTNGFIPKDGSGGAFGYGILTDHGFGAVIVSTTHKGVRDSETQGQGKGPIWHNHFVRLITDENGPCGTDPQVDAITFEQPGRIAVVGNMVALKGIPETFDGTNALNMHPLTLTPGHNVQHVVSFNLNPIFEDHTHHLQAVCVHVVDTFDHIIKN